MVEQLDIGPVQAGVQAAVFRVTTAKDRRLVAITVRTADLPTITALAYARECTGGRAAPIDRPRP